MKPNKDLHLIRAAQFSFGSEHGKVLTKMRFQKTWDGDMGQGHEGVGGWGYFFTIPAKLLHTLPSCCSPHFKHCVTRQGVGKGGRLVICKVTLFSAGEGRLCPLFQHLVLYSFLKDCI